MKSKKSKIIVIIGTRPEALKMWPIIMAFKAYPEIDLRVCLTAQHRDLLDQFVSELEIPVHVDLNLMMPEQTLEDLSSRLIPAVSNMYARIKPGLVLVQGDTTSAMLSALTAFYHHIPVGHVEAGLRSGVRFRPFPEEMNRRLLSRIADIHFAPTKEARKNLIREGFDGKSIHVTGNTIIDTVHAFSKTGSRVAEDPTILMTVHRREHHGKPIRDIFSAVADLAKQHPRLRIIYPVHPNPQVSVPAKKILGKFPNVQLKDPMGYKEFISLMQASWFLLSDSGGVQEEATALGKPVLLLRKETERPEGIAAGNVLPIGVDPDRIIDGVKKLLQNRKLRHRMSKISHVFGKGDSGKRIAEICTEYLR